MRNLRNSVLIGMIGFPTIGLAHTSQICPSADLVKQYMDTVHIHRGYTPLDTPTTQGWHISSRVCCLEAESVDYMYAIIRKSGDQPPYRPVLVCKYTVTEEEGEHYTIFAIKGNLQNCDYWGEGWYHKGKLTKTCRSSNRLECAVTCDPE